MAYRQKSETVTLIAGAERVEADAVTTSFPVLLKGISGNGEGGGLSSV